MEIFYLKHITSIKVIDQNELTKKNKKKPPIKYLNLFLKPSVTKKPENVTIGEERLLIIPFKGEFSLDI